MTLNIQEGIYSPHELACGVLVLRLVDSRQDFFCCLAASLMPALLGAELQPLAMLGKRALLPGAAEDPRGDGHSQQEHDITNKETTSAASTPREREASHATRSGKAECSEEAASQLPLPKELWWLLMHLHAKTVAASLATSAFEASRWNHIEHLNDRRRRRASRGGEQHRKESFQVSPLQTESSCSSTCSRRGDGCTSSSDETNECEDDCRCSSSCTDPWHQRPPAERSSHAGNVLALDIAVFLCTIGGESLTWPSFLAGADTYLQPQQRVLGSPGFARAGDNSQTLGQSCRSSRRRRGRSHRESEAPKDRNDSSSEEMDTSHKSSQDGSVKRDVAFLRACLERGIAIPEGVSLYAALLVSSNRFYGVVFPQ